jgi:hypothetical protein
MGSSSPRSPQRSDIDDGVVGLSIEWSVRETGNLVDLVGDDNKDTNDGNDDA